MNNIQSVIDEIKKRKNIVDLARELGLEPNGQDFIYSIYKEENNKSLKLYRKSNTYYCFATGKGGDVINFYADVKNKDNKQAIIELSKELSVGNFNETVETKKEEKIIDKHKCTEIYQYLEKLCGGLCEKSFQYLTGPKRGLTEVTIKKFRLFYIKDIKSIVDKLYQHYNLEELKAAGIFNPDRKFVFAKHRLIIPYLDGNQIVYLRGRILPENESNSAPKYIGLSGQRAKRFFNRSKLIELSPEAEILLCEGEFDTMRAVQEGLPAIGVPGVNNFPDFEKQLLKGLNVYICFDNDEAGRKGAQIVTNLIGDVTEGIFLDGCKDLTEYFNNNGNFTKLTEGSGKIIPERKRKSRLSLISARDVQKRDLPPVEWIVKDILYVGLVILAAPPKSGKSFFALNLALSVADGYNGLGYFETKKSKVLFIALEDSLRRIRERINNIMGYNIDKSATENLLFMEKVSDFSKINDGGLKEIEDLLEDDPEIRLIIIDTFGRSIADKNRRDKNIYLAEYELTSKLQQLAIDKNICILIIHHTKKGVEQDVFDEISGTRGIAGAADTTLIMKKINGEVTLYVIGRDIAEAQYKMVFDNKLCCWNIVDKGMELSLTPERKEIIDLMQKHNRAMRTGEISGLLNKEKSNVSKLLYKLASEGILENPKYGYYQLVKKNNDFEKAV